LIWAYYRVLASDVFFFLDEIISGFMGLRDFGKELLFPPQRDTCASLIRRSSNATLPTLFAE
jgi:hypothetical protein